MEFGIFLERGRVIKIKALTGPYAGQVRVPNSDVSPVDLLMSFLQHGWEWSIDFSHAGELEALEWARRDIGARMLRAQIQNKPIRFLGKDYANAQEAEDAITSSSRMIYVVRDNEEVLEIGEEGYEQ